MRRLEDATHTGLMVDRIQRKHGVAFLKMSRKCVEVGDEATSSRDGDTLENRTIVRKGVVNATPQRRSGVTRVDVQRNAP